MAAPVHAESTGDSPPIFSDIQTGLLFRNPQPHLKSVHAYFPSVVALPDGDWLASYMLGEAFEAVDTRVHLSRSTDQGISWQPEGLLATDLEGQLVSESGRLTVTPEGDVIALLHRHDRSEHPHEGLANPENMGFVPTDFAISRSSDGGRTWSTPENLDPPLVGPSFELCCPITPLTDGRWLLPTSTWRGWEGDLPNGDGMLALISHNRGASWPSYVDVMRDERPDMMFWESKIVELSEGRLLAVAWVYDHAESRDLPNHFVLSCDGGKTWTKPASTGLLGQTMTPLILPGDQILVVYRRIDQPGLWGQLAHLEGDQWVNDDAQPVWGHGAVGLTGTDDSMVANFQTLRFGAPCMMRCEEDQVFVAFWCYEDCVSVIRWFKFRVAV